MMYANSCLPKYCQQNRCVYSPWCATIAKKTAAVSLLGQRVESAFPYPTVLSLPGSSKRPSHAQARAPPTGQTLPSTGSTDQGVNQFVSE